MSVQKAMLVELFAIVLVLYGLATVTHEYTMGSPVYFHLGLYVGIGGMLYAVVDGVRSVGGTSDA
ncbi:hypothetical protein ACFQDG_03790 [Natronoarchaeum mannanilyticum]|uniref:Uncharacterized protein n=1 Tax=Natronoarchaeum mannanilyticum TaxID=926360 RepID=A0AAV3T8T4_9EURY